MPNNCGFLGVVARPEGVHKGAVANTLVCLPNNFLQRKTAADPRLRANLFGARSLPGPSAYHTMLEASHGE